jgi:signal transduction histidine kinase
MKSLIPLSEFIFDASKLFTRELTRKKLTLKTDIPSDLLVFVDPNRFKQVFNNLFSNAIQYTEYGGISITASKEDKMITIHFKDTGIGISAENLPLIFNRFFRADEARSRYAGGAGLGLAIAREIVNAHMGTIEADSQLGIGTEFVIRIPKI